MTTTFAAYIPVVPHTSTPISAPAKVADFDLGVVAVLVSLVIGMALLSRGR